MNMFTSTEIDINVFGIEMKNYLFFLNVFFCKLDYAGSDRPSRVN